MSTLLDLGIIRSTEFTSKKKGDYNVMVTGVTYELHSDIKS